MLLISVVTCFSCNTETKVTPLDIKEYLSHARTDIMYPSDKQIEMLRSVVPEHAFQPAPPITDRSYWDKIRSTTYGKEYLELALDGLDQAPEVPITDSIYRKANLEGNRGIYKPRYYRTMGRLENFILAECIENEGRFLPQIGVYIKAINDMKSWLHPNHDNANNDVLEGRTKAIDLGARLFGTDLALAKVLLADKLPDELRKEIASELQERIIDTYLDGCSSSEDRLLDWWRGSSNWNAVCSSGSMFTTIAASNDRDQRIAAIGSALNSMKSFVNGFGDDGYCSEGAGYWSYGFGHYLYLAQILYDYTEGQINLFEFDNPEKLMAVGSFPERYEIQNGTCAPFADGSSRVSRSTGFTGTLSYIHLGARKPTPRSGRRSNIRRSPVYQGEASYQLISWEYPEAFLPDSTTSAAADELPAYTYFDQFGMVISRGKQEVPFSIAIKAGHNDENHNHMDVGSYSIVLDRDHVSGDIGAPSYRAGAFDDDNPARSSWGHPVPRIDNIVQSKGREFAGTITTTEFSETYDKVVMDIKAAYEVPSLQTLVRTMENDKSGRGTISIADEFSSSEPIAFGTAIMTNNKYEVVNENTVIIDSEDGKLKAEVFSDHGVLKIKDELVPVEHLREGAPAYRIGIDFVEPLTAGTITVKYTPLL
ncbi:MAG: heparinase II/III family protein [Flavobacteriaceae bacterium]